MRIRYALAGAVTVTLFVLAHFMFRSQLASPFQQPESLLHLITHLRCKRTHFLPMHFQN